MKSLRGRTPGTSRRGQLLVEFALCLPLLLIILGGIIDTGFVLWKDNAISSSVREGALFAIRIRGNADSWDTDATDATITFIRGITGGTGLLDTDITITVEEEDANFGDADSIRITVNHTHEFLTPFNFAGAPTFQMNRSFATAFIRNAEGTR